MITDFTELSQGKDTTINNDMTPSAVFTHHHCGRNLSSI